MNRQRVSLCLILALCLSVCFARAETLAPNEASRFLCEHKNCFWSLPMDITNEEAIWEALMQPVWVLDGNERDQYMLRAAPNAEAEVVGEITYRTQGVHILYDLGNGWTLVEAYSSSFFGSKVEAWNRYVTGYVETALLYQIEPSSDYGFVVDKMTQRMYMFKDGKLYSTLRISTGLGTDEKPYNETISGQFLLTTQISAYTSNGIYTEMPIRFNDGDMIHQVPGFRDENGKVNYSSMEMRLGTRASAGCIRVQRHSTPEGISMSWIWLNYEVNTPIWIWEDLPGRTVSVPDDDTVLYYSSAYSRCYHTSAQCNGVPKTYWKTMQPITYGDLDMYRKAEDCPYCNPPLRWEDIASLNASYAKKNFTEAAVGNNP